MTFANLVVGPTLALLALLVALTLGRALVFLVLARVHLRRMSRRVPGPPIREPVTVVVPAYNEEAGIEAAVRSIVSSDHTEVEVLVVDDGSTDRFHLERLGLPGVRLIRQRNAGKARRCPRGSATPRIELVVLVDRDTILRPDTVRRIVQRFAESMWKHRSTVTARGVAGRLGRRGPAVAAGPPGADAFLGPVIDLIALFGLLFVDPVLVGSAWLAFLGLQTLLAGHALRLDGESLRPLWALPLQQVVYRQLIYLVVYHSVITALAGSRLGWHRMRRHGSTAALLREVERV